ncbi:hypothetical protein TeGR_g5483 [Tetraparma gracilis]|uniref:Ion transport domain-containing protein n=1 Tax=Tetraparma gracilis TaxID=2962635 RepID=A0ABQ6MD58_9STRA|nr:hypothetical protein TeGR_g5483 [Tetraparma gracilis]
MPTAARAKRTYNRITLFYTFLLLLSFLLYLLPPAISLLLRPYARLLLFIAHNKAVLRELKLILNLLPEVAKILSLEFLIIGIYAWWGTMMFANSSEEGRENFSSWGASVWSLWTLVTTANFPNVMMPAYSKNRAAVIFFSSFLLLAMFLMVNLLLAAVYNNYQEERKGFQKNVQKNALSNLRAAFSVLDVENNGVIYKPQMLLLFTELNEHIAAIKHIPKEKQDVMLSVLDVSGDQEWDLDEFLGFVAVLQIEFESEENLKGLVEHSFPSVYASPTFQAVEAAVLAPSFEYFIDAALILNTLVIMLQNKHELVGDSSSGEMHGGAVVMELIDVVFLVVFVAEVLLRVAVVGWRRYWGSYRFRFDFVVTFLSVFATVLYWLPGQIQEKSVVQTIMMVRLLRLVRLVMAVNAFAVIGDTVTEIIPVCSRMFMVLFCITYLFAVTAVNTLGGAVSIDPAAPSFPALMASDYGTSNFYANNFNDMLGSFVVLFELLVVNNWTVTCDGYEIVTGSKLVRLFFASFHIVGVLIINNLVISFIVDSFSTEYEAEISSRKGEGAGGVGGDSKVHQFDAAALGSGSVSGKWTATVQRGKDGGKRRESLLQSMFRQRKGSAK